MLRPLEGEGAAQLQPGGVLPEFRPFRPGQRCRKDLYSGPEEKKLLTRIKGLYSILDAIAQIWQMIRNATRLTLACVVLGLVNQACAVTNGSRATAGEIATAKTYTQPAPQWPQTVEVAMPLSVPTPSPSVAESSRAELLAWRNSSRPRQSKAVQVAANSVGTLPPYATALVVTPDAVPQRPGVAAPHLPNVVAAPPAASSGVPEAIVTPASPSVVREPATVPLPLVIAPPASIPTALPAPTYSDSPVPPKSANLWDRIRSGFSVRDIDSPLVQRHVAWYLNRPDYMQRMMERSRRYLHFVVEELEKRQMPLELALLPMIESAYNPIAYSTAKASGIWQFIPATGKHYGLEQNWWYDGRRDVTAATFAALDYLQKLYGDFGDWQLALAAYNWGEGSVARAVERNARKGQSGDYESLHMPAETANYVPKLQAVKNIIADPARYGVVLEDIPNQPYFIKVAAPAHIDFKRAAQLAEVPLEEFRYLNPAHNRPVITSSGRTLLLPVDKAGVFTANLEANDDPLVTWQTYTLRQKEGIEQVAARFHMTAATLRQVNGLDQRRKVRSGHTLLVPLPGNIDAGNFDNTYSTLDFQPAPAAMESIEYRVRRGDTMRSIALRHRVTMAQLQRWNHLQGRLAVGQALAIYPDTGAKRVPPTQMVKGRPHQTNVGLVKVRTAASGSKRAHAERKMRALKTPAAPKVRRVGDRRQHLARN